MFCDNERCCMKLPVLLLEPEGGRGEIACSSCLCCHLLCTTHRNSHLQTRTGQSLRTRRKTLFFSKSTENLDICFIPISSSFLSFTSYCFYLRSLFLQFLAFLGESNVTEQSPFSRVSSSSTVVVTYVLLLRPVAVHWLCLQYACRLPA
jgi:hypothetical protein